MGLLGSIGGILGTIIAPGVGTAIGSALGGLGDSAISSNAAKNAAKDQGYAADAAANRTDAQYAQSRADLAPWRLQGGAAVTRLGDLTGTSGNTDAEGYGSLAKPFSMSDFEADPGYAFRLSEGQKAIDRASSARGKYFGGETGKALTRFNQNTASDEYQNAYNRFNTNQTNLYNRLAGVAQTGQTANNTLVSAGANATSNANDIRLTGAAADASGGVASSNIWQTGLANAGDTLGGLFKPSTQPGTFFG